MSETYKGREIVVSGGWVTCGDLECNTNGFYNEGFSRFLRVKTHPYDDMGPRVLLSPEMTKEQILAQVIRKIKFMIDEGY